MVEAQLMPFTSASDWYRERFCKEHNHTDSASFRACMVRTLAELQQIETPGGLG